MANRKVEFSEVDWIVGMGHTSFPTKGLCWLDGEVMLWEVNDLGEDNPNRLVYRLLEQEKAEILWFVLDFVRHVGDHQLLLGGVKYNPYAADRRPEWSAETWHRRVRSTHKPLPDTDGIPVYAEVVMNRLEDHYG